MPLWTPKTTLNRGELDPLLVGRIDLQAYYQGLAKATNVLTIPQGGVKRRPGTTYIEEMPGDGRLENFGFSTDVNYLLCFTDLRMYIFKEGVLQTNINGSGNDWLDTPWTLAQVKEFDYIQSLNTIIITHEDVEPQLIGRTSDTAWSINAVPLTNIPQYDFDDASSPTPVSEVQQITFASPNNGDTYKLSLDGFLTEEIVFSQSTVTNASNIRAALLDLPNTGNSGVGVSYLGPGFLYQVTFSGESADDYGEITGTGVDTKDVNFDITATEIQAGTSSKEDTWSNLRGWPRTCTFHEGRLYFGGSKLRKQTLWGSIVNDFYNFDSGRARDDESVEATLDTDQVNAINAIYSNRSLQIFTSGSEFYVKDSPETPSNLAVVPQTNKGSKRVRPVTIDGVTLFVQRTGKVINQFVFINEYQSNQTASVSTLAPHLINNPVKLAVAIGNESSDANYVYILNDNGGLTVFNTLATEDVQAFTSWVSGNIKSIAVVDDLLYMLVEREVDGNTVYYIEVESEANTDSAVIQNNPGTDTITGLDHLEGLTVDVKADGAYQGQFVVSGGQVVITRDIDENSEVGIPYTPLIKTMPLNVDLRNGPNAYSKKRILRAAIQQYQSNGILVNGQRLADRTIALNQFNAPEPQTGLKRITLLGWSLTADIEITQDTPFPMTILSIGMEVKD